MKHTMYRSEKGQSMILLALMFVALLGMLALAVDGGLIYFSRRNAQAAADAAALAGALAKARGTSPINAALEMAQKNGFDNDGQENSVLVYNPPQSGQYQGEAEYIQVVITQTIQTSFLHFVYPGAAANTSQAVARASQTGGGLPLGGPNALVAADPSECRSFYTDGGAYLRVEGGGIFVNSNCQGGSSNGAFYMTGNPTVITNNGITQVVGNYYKPQWSGTLTPLPATGAAQRTYGDLDAPDCSLRSNFSNDPNYNINRNGTFGTYGTHTASPGVYAGGFRPTNGVTVNMEPGLYCIDGDFRVSGGARLTGDGVVIVLRGGRMEITNGVYVYLRAPSSNYTLRTESGGTANFKGMLVLGNPSEYSSPNREFVLNGGANSTLVGTIYVPKMICNFNNGSTTGLFDTQMVCRIVRSTGGTNVVFHYNGDHYYVGGGGDSFLIEMSE